MLKTDKQGSTQLRIKTQNDKLSLRPERTATHADSPAQLRRPALDGPRGRSPGDDPGSRHHLDRFQRPRPRHHADRASVVAGRGGHLPAQPHPRSPPAQVPRAGGPAPSAPGRVPGGCRPEPARGGAAQPARRGRIHGDGAGRLDLPVPLARPPAPGAAAPGRGAGASRRRRAGRPHGRPDPRRQPGGPRQQSGPRRRALARVRQDPVCPLAGRHRVPTPPGISLRPERSRRAPPDRRRARRPAPRLPAPGDLVAVRAGARPVRQPADPAGPTAAAGPSRCAGRLGLLRHFGMDDP